MESPTLPARLSTIVASVSPNPISQLAKLDLFTQKPVELFQERISLAALFIVIMSKQRLQNLNSLTPHRQLSVHIAERVAADRVILASELIQRDLENVTSFRHTPWQS